jgi:3-dehydroquinate synthase
MEELKINTGTAISRILLGESFKNFKHYIPPGKKIIVITDVNLNKHYGKYFNDFSVIEIGTGEQIKTLATVEYIIDQLIVHEADRSGFILGVGGGIVTDIVGFIASVYMRGLMFGFVSTSLLSMVDASVGGKNGVNFRGFKNMIGVFNQPEFVICDFEMLATLEKEEFIGGFAEIIKHGAIKDIELFGYLEKNYNKALECDKGVLHRLVRDSILIKSKVVEQDEREKGERKKLNFGHTFGHAIEKLTSLSHGKSVAIGMCLASRLSVLKNRLTESDAKRLISLIERMGLPVSMDVDLNELLGAMKKDKKREGGDIHMILLKGLGNAIIENFTYNDLEEIIYDLRSVK